MLYKTLLTMTCMVGLTACQTTTVNLPQNNQENGKQLLNQAFKKAFFQSQTWVSEHQLYLKNTPKSEETDPLTNCQTEHDNRFVAQMTADNLLNFSDVGKLSDDKQQAYKTIQQDYIACQAKFTPENANAEAENFLVDSILADEKNELEQGIDDLNDVMKIMGLSSAQIDSLNQFLLKSGKVTITGNYQPLAGEMSLLVDAGFENKNLKYHYRLPIVANAKQQAIYVKPDIFMPSVALHLDNQLGVSWQDKWYKVNLKQDDSLPADMQIKAWAYALQQSFDELPTSQFAVIDSVLLLPNIAQARQKIAKNGTVIKWHQTAKEQDNLYQDMLNNFINKMDSQIAKTDNPHYQNIWQKDKAKLQERLENRLAIEPNDKNRLTGQSMYFIVENGKLKQIFTQNKAKMLSQDYQLNSFITFDPDESLIHSANQPKTLAKLQKTIHDNENGNVVDAKAEIERLVKLDNSRRLFGTEPEWLKYLSKIVKIENDDDDE